MQIWVSNLSTDDQSTAVSKSEDGWHYSFTMLWNQYTSVIYKYYYYYLQEKKMSYMNDLKVTVCIWLSSDFYLTCMHCLVSMKRALKCKKKTTTYSKCRRAHHCHPNSHHLHHSASDHGYNAYCCTETVQLCTTVVAFLHV